MKLRVLGTGVAMAVSLTGAALAVPATSYAATSCYTNCHTTPPTHPGGKPSDGSSDGGSDGGTPATTAQAQALAFTGANVIVPTGIGAGAVLVGGTLIVAGKRRRIRSAAS